MGQSYHISCRTGDDSQYTSLAYVPQMRWSNVARVCRTDTTVRANCALTRLWNSPCYEKKSPSWNIQYFGEGGTVTVHRRLPTNVQGATVFAGKYLANLNGGSSHESVGGL